MPTSPEDLLKLKAILAANKTPGQVEDFVPPVPHLDPSIVSDPYNKTAAGYNTKADTYQAAADKPQDQPVGVKQNLIAGLRNAMENMGRLGAPGGYYGQEEKRTQDFDKERALNLSQADKLRALAEKQQGLGVNAANEQRQENYNQGQLAATEELRKRQEEQTQETIRHNQFMEGQDKFGASANGMVYSEKTGHVAREPNAKTSNQQSKAGMLDGKPFFADYNPGDGSYHHPETKEDISGRFQPFPPGTGSENQFLQSTDANGNPVYLQGNKKTGTVTPAHMAGDPNSAVPTADAGKRNVQSDAKAMDEYNTALKSFNSMVGLAKDRTYPSDQAIGDAFFNIIKPGSGARMNDAAIQRYLTPGPLASKMHVWAQKLSTGAPLDDQARAEIIQAAQRVLTSKKPVPRAAAQPSNGWSVQEVH